MNYWLFTIAMKKYEKNFKEEFNNLETNFKFYENIKQIKNIAGNNIGDIIFFYNSESSTTKKKYPHSGIYLVCKITSLIDEDNEIELEVIKSYIKKPYQYKFDFPNLYNEYNIGRVQPKKLIINSEDAGKIYDLLIEGDFSNSNSLSNDLLENLGDIIGASNLSTEAEAAILIRLGQGKFRDQLIQYWDGCSVTKCSLNDILIASHIKPWKVSSDKERLDVYNGFLLQPNIDKLFDKGYISFDDNGEIIISDSLQNYELLGVNKNMKIELDNKHKKYLKFHRENIFQKNK